jgi:hypothetical protein
VYPEPIVVVAEREVVCEHLRSFARSHERKSTATVYDWRRYLAVIQRKLGALRNGVCFGVEKCRLIVHPRSMATDRSELSLELVDLATPSPGRSQASALSKENIANTTVVLAERNGRREDFAIRSHLGFSHSRS